MSSMADIHSEGKIRPRIYCVVLSELPDVLVTVVQLVDARQYDVTILKICQLKLAHNPTLQL